MSSINIKFSNKTGEKLSAILELPIDRKPHNFVIFSHCFTCSKNLVAVRNISRSLIEEGFGVLSFDFTGLEMSEGDFSETNFSTSVDDLLSAAEFLKENYKAPTVMIGHSLGGAATLFAASQLDEVKAVATIGTPAEPQHVASLLQDSIEEINSKGEANVSIGGRPFLIKKHFVEDLKGKNLLDVVKKMRKAFLFLHSPQDSIVGVENAEKLYRAAFHPKSFVSLDGADHLLSDKKDACYVGNLIASWAMRYVEIPAEKELRTKSHIVAYLGKDDKFTTQIKSNNHRLVADEPTTFGGNDYGPSPYELVSSGLAACTAITIKMYAERKKWDLEEVFVHVKYDKVYMEDCAVCESKDSKLDQFMREIELKGNLNNEQKQKLLEIADKCPVHRTLESKAQIETKLLD